MCMYLFVFVATYAGIVVSAVLFGRICGRLEQSLPVN